MPPILILGGISGAGMTTAMEAYRPFLMAVTFGLLGLAFYLTYRQPRVARRGSSRIVAVNKVVLWVVTAMVAIALFCPQFFVGLSGIQGGEATFTADMDRTLLTVEGMTCPG